jgi:hypothetical protein
MALCIQPEDGAGRLSAMPTHAECAALRSLETCSEVRDISLCNACGRGSMRAHSSHLLLTEVWCALHVQAIQFVSSTGLRNVDGSACVIAASVCNTWRALAHLLLCAPLEPSLTTLLPASSPAAVA